MRILSGRHPGRTDTDTPLRGCPYVQRPGQCCPSSYPRPRREKISCSCPALARHPTKFSDLRDEGVAGSNPATPTITYLKIQRSPAPIAAPFCSARKTSAGRKINRVRSPVPKESAELAGLSANGRFPTKPTISSAQDSLYGSTTISL